VISTCCWSKICSDVCGPGKVLVIILTKVKLRVNMLILLNIMNSISSKAE